MYHEIFTIIDFAIVGPYRLWLKFDGESVQVIDLSPLLRGEMYGSRSDLSLFNQIRLDSETGTIVWPSGADFDPASLHDWERVGEAMIAMAASWSDAEVNQQHMHSLAVT